MKFRFPVGFFLIGLGFAAAQSVWLDRLSVLFGQTAGATAVVLGMVFLGQSLGFRHTAGRAAPSAGAGWALVWAGAAASTTSLVLLFTGFASFGGVFVRWTVAALLVLVPSAMAGAAFSRLVLCAEARGGSSRAALGLHSLGFLAGLLSTLVIVPLAGLPGLAALSAAAFAGAWMCLRNAAIRAAAVNFAPARASPIFAAAIFLAGFSAMAVEMAWFRAAAMLFGSTSPGFTAAYAAVLAWYAAGNFAARRIPGLTPAAALLGIFLALPFSLLALLPVYELIPYSLVKLFPWFFGSPAKTFAAQFALCTAVFGAPAFLFGTVLPTAMAGGRGSAAALFWSALGNAAGGIFAVWLLLPRGGPEWGIRAGSLGYAAALGLLAVGPDFRPAEKRAAWAAGAILVLGSLWYGRPWNVHLLQSGAFLEAPRYLSSPDARAFTARLEKHAVVFDREGASARVTVFDAAGGRYLRVGGTAEAADRGERATQRMLAHLPASFLTSPARRALVVGVGSGATAGAFSRLPGLERLDAVEIEPAVLEAAEYFEAANDGFWRFPGYRGIAADARRFLARSTETYDVISSQPSHPWISGAMFTREAFQSIKDRLSPGGVACQWVNGYSIGAEDFKTILRTFAGVFPHVALYQFDGPHFLVLGSALPLEEKKARAGDFAAARLLSDEELRGYVGAGPLSADLYPRLKYSTARWIQRGLDPALLDGIQDFRGPKKVE